MRSIGFTACPFSQLRPSRASCDRSRTEAPVTFRVWLAAPSLELCAGGRQLCSDFGRWPAALELRVSATLLTVGRRSAVAASGRCKRYS
jgi:hypothetical protein